MLKIDRNVKCLLISANINNETRKERLKPIRKLNWSSYLALLIFVVFFQKKNFSSFFSINFVDK